MTSQSAFLSCTHSKTEITLGMCCVTSLIQQNIKNYRETCKEANLLVISLSRTHTKTHIHDLDLVTSENIDLVISDSVMLANVRSISVPHMQKDDQMHELLLCLSLQFSTHHIYPLTSLWVKPVTEDSNGL